MSVCSTFCAGPHGDSGSSREVSGVDGDIKPSLLLAARGLICNSGGAADTVQRSITSLRRGEEKV